MFVAAPIRRAYGLRGFDANGNYVVDSNPSITGGDVPTLLRPGESALLSPSDLASIQSLFGQQYGLTPSTTRSYGPASNTTTPPAPPSKFAQWWQRPSAISDSFTNGNLVEIAGVFLGSMVMVSMIRRSK